MDKGKTIGDSQTGWNVFSDAGPKEPTYRTSAGPRYGPADPPA
jgi:hypothetical protein